MSCLQAALTYAARGWNVVPLNWPCRTADGTLQCSCPRGERCPSPGKHPWIKWRESGGTTDSGLIRWYWRTKPDSGVAILTGAGRSGLFAVDIDPDHGGRNTLEQLQQQHGQLPDTLTATTGSGGTHLIFRYPPSKARQTAGALGPGVDTRSDGGLIVAAPSLHKSGQRYTWDNWGADVAEMPPWVIARMKPAPKRTLTAAERVEAMNTDPDSIAGQAFALVATAASGTRHDTLVRTAWNLARLVEAGRLPEHEYRRGLADAARRCGLDDDDAEAAIDSALDKHRAA